MKLKLTVTKPVPPVLVTDSNPAFGPKYIYPPDEVVGTFNLEFSSTDVLVDDDAINLIRGIAQRVNATGADAA